MTDTVLYHWLVGPSAHCSILPSPPTAERALELMATERWHIRPITLRCNLDEWWPRELCPVNCTPSHRLLGWTHFCPVWCVDTLVALLLKVPQQKVS